MRRQFQDVPGGEGRSLPLPIYDVTPFTMLDFPDKCAAIIWFSGCNMRCPYCHNPQIVKGKGAKDIDDVLGFLERRQGLLDGVVLSGGEVSIYSGLPDFVAQVRGMGYAVKMDTNGTRPDVIQSFLDQGFLDYVALDYKSPADKFRAVTGSNKFQEFECTLDLLCAQGVVPFEVRTTVHTGLMDEDDVCAIIHDLERRGYAGSYYVQNFINNGGETLGCLPPQARELDLQRIPTDCGVSVVFRNFDCGTS